MGKLDDLRKQLSSMTHQEKLDRIRLIRKERKINRVGIIKAKQSKKKSMDKLAKQLANMTPEMLKELGLL